MNVKGFPAPTCCISDANGNMLETFTPTCGTALLLVAHVRSKVSVLRLCFGLEGLIFQVFVLDRS